MRKFLLTLAAIVFCLLAFQPRMIAQTYPTFSNFTTNPIDADGIYGGELQSYIDNGWVLLVTTVDLPNRLVQFRNATTGVPEWRIGTIPAGTAILANGCIKEVRIQQCGNTADCFNEVSWMYGGLSLPSECYNESSSDTRFSFLSRPSFLRM